LKDFQEKMLQQIRILTEIADEFSNYAELPKGKKQELDLIDIIHKIRNLFKHEEDVKFNVNFQKNSSFRLIGDENQLIRLFNNLIQNSLHAMDHNGHIEINIFQEENKITVSFIDSGPGIQKIFRIKYLNLNSPQKQKAKDLA
jgi:signal transduction histidine kinase